MTSLKHPDGKHGFDRVTWDDAGLVIESVTEARLDGELPPLVEFNPHHDAAGRFAPKPVGGVTGPDLGAASPTTLDAEGQEWLDASGQHSPGWGPRGQLNDAGEELLSAKVYGRYEKYAVPRGYHDVANAGPTGKGWDYSGDGVAFTRPIGGEQHFQVRLNGTKTLVTTEGKGGLHQATVDGKRIGQVSDIGKGKWTARRAGDTDNSGMGSLQMKYDSKPLAVLGLVKDVATFGISEARLDGELPPLVEFNPYHDARGRFTTKGGRGALLDNRTLAAKVASGADEGGGSFDLAGGSPTSGIMVSYAKGDGHGRILEAKTKAERDAAIKEWVAEQRKFVSSNKDNHYGVWVDGGKTYLDVSKRFPKEKRDAAIKAGKDQNQIAVFDLDTFTEIGTGGTGE